jgi:hypothetical protein
MADKVDLTSTSHPLRFIRLPFQLGSLSAILSIRGWNPVFGSLLMTEKGFPRYFRGKSTSCHGNNEVAIRIWGSSQQMVATCSSYMPALKHLQRVENAVDETEVLLY